VAAPVQAPAVPPIDWLRIEQSLRESLVRDLQPALAEEVSRLLRERLQPTMERSLQAVSAELRQSFEARLRHLVAQAVAAEVERERQRR
jgi:hypothetical protein